MIQLPPHLFISQHAVPDDWLFRLMQPADKRLLADFLLRVVDPDFNQWFKQLTNWQAIGRAYWVIGFAGSTLIASGQLFLVGHNAELSNLVVAPDWQGQGVGSALIGILEQIARQAKVAHVEIGVIRDNERALALYQRLGYEYHRKIGLPEGETAVFLRKALR